MSLSVSIQHKLNDFSLDVEFELPDKGLTALFGPSGSGKSVTINTIAGLLEPDAGHISIKDLCVFDHKTKQNLPAHKRRIGYVFQDSRLFPHLTTKANLLFGAKRASKKPTEAQFDHLVNLLDIEHLLSRHPANLSGGEKQRVAIGRAILSDPSLLLLDEPMAALDHNRQIEIMRLIERIRDESEIPILFVSHSISEVTRLADHMILLNKGKIAAEGPVHDIMNRLDLFPLTGRFETGSSFTAKVINHDDQYGMSEVSFGSSRLWLPKISANEDDYVRLRIRARDVMLSLTAPKDISANNILPVKIIDWREDGNLHVDLQLRCSDTILLARITQKSLKRMGLEKGTELFAIVKSVSLDRRMTHN